MGFKFALCEAQHLHVLFSASIPPFGLSVGSLSRLFSCLYFVSESIASCGDLFLDSIV